MNIFNAMESFFWLSPWPSRPPPTCYRTSSTQWKVCWRPSRCPPLKTPSDLLWGGYGYVVVKNLIQVKIKFLCLLTLIRVRKQRKLRIKLC